ncbi:hypothetical protein [Peterkaempfera griseoplana]|uniref:hypothetical protein n=1 Tax=Peterkaempfera griseoplana TaxID=66896 RepID=UPI0006E32096|nr:hypothetical protein [Peterkaempfera griseoplana]
MSVDFFWRRVAGTSLDELSPEELSALVPHWFDPEIGPLREAGMVMAVERNGSLMHFALTAGGAVSGGVAQLPVFGGERRADGREDPEYGFVGAELLVLRPDEVQAASAFLNGVAVDDLVRELGAALAGQVRALGFSTPWSQRWAAGLAADMRDLKDFFAAAAAAGDAVIKFESA